MGDNNADRSVPEANTSVAADTGATQDSDHRTKPRHLVLTAIAVSICLVATTVVGSILVNVNWPTTLGAWLKALLGGLLLLIGTGGITYATTAITGLIKDRGGRDSAHAEKYRILELLSEIKLRKAVLATILATAIFIAAILSPRLAFPEPPPSEPGVIMVMSAIDESPRDPRYMLIQQWNNAHPENRVELIPVSGETTAQHTSMVNDAKGERSADVYVLDIVWMSEFIEHGYIRRIDESRLTEYDGDQFFTNNWDTCRDSVGGRDGRWALPFNSDAGLLYYRSDWRVSEPKTWGDYFGTSAEEALGDMARRPRAKEIAPNLKAANAAQLTEEEILNITALESIWAAGGEVVNESGRLVLNEDESEVVFDSNAKAALEELAAAADSDKGIILPESDDMDEQEATRAFQNGETLFMRNWPVAYENLTAEGGEDISFEVASLPHDSVLGGQNLAISSATDKPRAAQELIEFLTSPSSQLTLFEVGGFAPTRPSAFVNSRRPYALELRSAIENARIRPTLVSYTEFSVEFSKGIARALNDQGKLEPDFAKRLADIVKKDR